MTGPIFNAVRQGNNGPNEQSTGVHRVSPTTSTFSGTTVASITKGDLKDATRHRKGFSLFTSFLFLATVVFLIFIHIGNLSNQRVLGELYFFKIDLSQMISASMGGQTQQTLTRAIGLHDFYQVGLWNFCEGYRGQGITGCSKPQFLYWFNPVQILTDELLNGETVPLPQQVVDYLTTVQSASKVMFWCFFGSTITSFIAIFLCPLAVQSKLASVPVGFFAAVSALATAVGAAVATAMWSILRRTVEQYAGDLGVTTLIGAKMMAFVWAAAGCAGFAAIGQVGMMCCGTSRRDVTTGRRVGRRQRTEKVVIPDENPRLRRRWWGSVSQ